MSGELEDSGPTTSTPEPKWSFPPYDPALNIDPGMDWEGSGQNGSFQAQAHIEWLAFAPLRAERARLRAAEARHAIMRRKREAKRLRVTRKGPRR